MEAAMMAILNFLAKKAMSSKTGNSLTSAKTENNFNNKTISQLMR